MITALNVANNILFRAFNEKCDTTPMKLQKLLYFVYKTYLQKTETALFSDRIEAWKYGPVIAVVHNEFKAYKAKRIKKFHRSVDGSIWAVDEDSDEDFYHSINYVWGTYKDYNGISLSILTHKPGTAWRKAYEAGELYLNDLDILNEGCLT